MRDESLKTKLQVTLLLAIAAVTWYITLVVRGHINPFTAQVGDQVAGITFAITVTSIGVVTFQRRLWRFLWLRPWLVDTPLLAGNWNGEVLRKYKGSGRDTTKVSVKVTVEQPTISTIRFIQTMTDRSAEGHTESCQLFRPGDGKYYLEGIYQITKNEEHSETEGQQKIYYGAMRLQLNENIRPTELSGSYWSDQFTRGRVVLKRAK